MPIHGLRISPREGDIRTRHNHAAAYCSCKNRRALVLYANSKGVVITGGNRGFGCAIIASPNWLGNTKCMTAETALLLRSFCTALRLI